MKRLFTFVITVFTVIFSNNAFGQSTPGLKTLIPPSPNAASLGKYGEIPISLYTGIPNINVPLYTLKGRDLDLPISLSYHAGGARVEEIASWAGLGWSLNAGGIITRSIRGWPDDILGGYFGARVNITAFAKKYMNTLIPSHSYVDGGGNGISGDLYYLDSYQGSAFDSEPDIFYFNFGKYSGKFFMNENGDFVTSPLQALKIECVTGNYNDGGAYRWILTTPDGVRYVFGYSLDNSRGALENNSNAQIWNHSTTGWYLVEIYSPNNDLISLNYSTIAYSNSTRSSAVLNQLISTTNGGSNLGALPFNGISTTNNVMSVPRLTSISSVNGAITFGAGADRTDLPGEAPLDNIKIFNNNDLVNPLKKYLFDYDYSSNRLTLKTLSEFSGNGTTSGNIYKFQYNPIPLPSVIPNQTAINSQDLWGYYNGASNNVFPQGLIVSTPTWGNISVIGADRHSDEYYMKAGALEKITYPTGGYTQFDYEANKLFDVAADNSIPPQPVTKGGGFQFFYNTTKADTFTVENPPPSGYCIATGNLRAISQGCPFDNVGYSQCYFARIEGINGTSFGPYYFKEGAISINLPPGTYRMVGEGTSMNGQQDNVFYFFLSWQEYPPQTTTSPSGMANKVMGGLRIKRITNYDGASTSVTKYLYNKFSDTASSAVIVNRPSRYGSILTMVTDECANIPSYEAPTSVYLQVKGYPMTPLMPTQGSPVGYQNVTVLSGENGENGKVEHTFTTALDYSDDITDFLPYAPPCSFDWRRGQLLKSTTYKNANGNFTPVSSIANQYLTGAKTSVAYGVKVERNHFVYTTAECAPYQISESDFYAGGYKTVGEFCYLQTETSRLYDQTDPSAYIEKVNNYSYDTVKGHYQLLSTKTTNSKNQVVEIDNKYPQDLTLSGIAETARQQLIANFMLTPVLDQQTIENGIQTKEIKNNYKVFSNGQVLPESIELQISNNPSEKRVEFQAYDNYGNILQQHKMNDVVNAYVWNYNNSFPIAAVTNTDLPNIAYSGFEADGSGNWTIGSTARNTSFAITGSNSYSLNSDVSKSGLTSGTTYVVSYWTRNSSPFTISGTISGFPTKGKTINGWTLYVHKVTGQTTISINGSGLIDEVRLYPANAQMTTYTYTPLVGMTSQCDVGNRITYYEYDGLQRLKRIRDQDYNIIKSYDYQYQVISGCGPNCYPIPMQTFAGGTTLGYPVGVFNVSGKLLGKVTNQIDYATTWNSDPEDALIGTLAAGADSLHFNMTLNAGKVLPSGVIGCRYYQVDLAWNKLDAVRNRNGEYVDFGDGTGMHLGKLPTDIPSFIAPNTTYATISDWSLAPLFYASTYFIHTYADSIATSLKTLTFYHNDAAENEDFDNVNGPALGLTKLKNLRGNLPLNTTYFGGSCYQEPTMTSVANISNWNSINSILHFRLNNGDNANPAKNISYPQDFMQLNKGLVSIFTTLGPYRNGTRDPNFKISLLKSDWSTYFTKLKMLNINDAYWNREDLSNLTELNDVQIFADTQNHQDDPNSPLINIPQPVIDAIINQVAAGAGKSVWNGYFHIESGTTTRSAASDASVQVLKAKGWQVILNGVTL